MKAKYYIGILSALMLAGIPLKAQYADNRNVRNDNASIIVNNYYDDYDYYFSSRINRFHRSYAAFEYYSPVFTETYWYNYRPYSWGVSIYGGTGLGFGLSYNYPVYYYGWNYGNWYSYDYGWYDPYYGSYWWGYDPFYYSWYSPVIININIGNRWGHNYWGWNRHNYWGGNRYNYWYNDYRPIYNTYNNYNNYPANRYSSREYPDRGRPAEYNRTNNPTRRSAEVRNNTGNTGNNNANVNNGNNRNSRVDGNNGNFGENNRNTNNNGNNRNSRTDGNNGNFGNNQNTRNQNGNQVSPPDNVRTSTVSTRSTVTQPSMSSDRRIEQPVPARSSTPSRTGTTMSQGRSSTPSRTGTTMSQGRSSSSRSASSSSTSKSSSGTSSSSKKSRR